MTFKIEIERANAERIADWLANRGGVAIWESRDLRSAGARSFTPALTTTGEPTTAPGWQWNTTPVEIVTQVGDIGVYDEVLYKAFPVTLRRSSSGMSLKLTDASQRKVDKIMRQCRDEHGGSHYKKGVLPDKAASIGVYYAGEASPL